MNMGRIDIDKNRNILTSPFIAKTKDNGNAINNLLNGEVIIIDDIMYSVLKECKNRITLEKLCELYGVDMVSDLLEKKLLLFEDEIWITTNIEYLEIETSTHCNYRCEYCPVALHPRKIEYMSMELFDEIITKAENSKKIKAVTLHSYNEPTIDKYFEERVLRLAKSKIKLWLHTNGSDLDDKKIELLKDSNVLSRVIFNLPSLDEQIFEKMTGYPHFSTTIKNIDNAVEKGLPVRFSVQGTLDEVKHNYPAIKNKYGDLAGDIADHINKYTGYSSDRAGILKNKYARNIDIKEKYLYGFCDQMLTWLHISINGDIYICFNDYFQNEVCGNITNGKIDELSQCEKAQNLRKMIYGYKEASDNLICRKCKDMEHAKLLSIYNRSIVPNFSS